jgi:hypothetical protein
VSLVGVAAMIFNADLSCGKYVHSLRRQITPMNFHTPEIV